MPKNKKKNINNTSLSTDNFDTKNADKDENKVSPVELPPTMTVGELSSIISKSNVDTIKSLMRQGIMATVNQSVEFDIAAKVAASFGIGVIKPIDKESSKVDSSIGKDETIDESTAEVRPPVITILGHVDHGKTTLLDKIRGGSVVDSEAGGITQNIGAYQTIHNGKKITFIDTPGHEAFTSMRANGAQVTDISILVVAADDGVMPQTIEAIDHSRAAGVPIVVAINKIDSPGADIDRVKGQLVEQDLIVEDYGGDVVSTEISALKGEGIDSLLESLVLVSEIEELKTNVDKDGMGIVIEASIDKNKGITATVLVKSGTVKLGHSIVVGTSRGRIKSMTDGFGNNIDHATASTPVKILGLNTVPNTGERLDVVENDKVARNIVSSREKYSKITPEERSPTTMLEVMRKVHSSEAKELRLVVKTGAYGSIDAVERALAQLSGSDVQLKLLRSATGAITESDIMLASASDAMVVGFETISDRGAKSLAESEGVVIRLYDVIYNLIDDVKNAAKSLLDPTYKEMVIGHALVQEIFPRGKRQKIAGVRVTSGSIKRNSRLRVLRGGDLLHDGVITSMRHLSENVRELSNNFEGGIMIDGFHDYEERDELEAYELKEE